MRFGRSVFESNSRVISGARHLGAVTAVAGIGVYLCAQVGFRLSIPPTGVAILWPGSGFVLAALIIAERRSWTAIILGAAVGGFIADRHNGATSSVAAWSAAANCVESLAAAWLVTRLAGPRVALRTLREMRVLFVGAAGVSNAFTALIGAVVLRRGGFDAFWPAWFVWWIGDGLGMLVVAPVILTWADAVRRRSWLPRPAALEAAASFVALGLVAYALLSYGRAYSTAFSADAFLLTFPLLLWLASRFGTWGASTALLILSVTVLWVTAHGAGLFAVPGASPSTQAHAVGLYLVLACVCTMIPASMLRERQHADAQARESEARFREMAEHIQEAFFIVDVVRGTTLYVSPTWAKIWGRPLADGYDPKVWFEALHPDDRAAMASSQAAISRGETSDLVFRVIRPNGDLRWVRGLAYPVRNRLGTVHRLVGISEDITAQYEAQETVRRSHAQLSQTGRMAHVGGWQLHVDTQQLTLTDEVYRIFEVDPASTPTVADMMQLCKPSARSEVTAALQAAIEVGTAFDIELPIETARGREILVHAHGEADRQDGRVARVLGVVQDITERTRLDDLRRLQSAALDAAANAIVITDRQGTIVWTNLAFTRLTGYVTSEAIGRNPRDLVKSGKESVAFYRALWETILSGRTWEGETINRRKDGSLYTESQAITPITDASGAITHFVAIKIDITPRLTLEGQLRQAQKMETMGQLASAIAHDFNNLLTVINGVGELAIAEIAEDDPVRADVQEMVRAGERSAQLTRQLLAFGRRQVLQPKVIHLNTAVIDAQSLLRRLLGEEIELAFELSPDLGNVRADMGQLEQVIVNLAVNARDAMPRGGRLTVHTRNVVVDDSEKIQSSVPMPPGHYVQLSVRDTGIGMDEATLARIFDPFFTTKPLGEGTGLGLSTVWGIVGQSDGFVLVDSTLGLGTTFRILLPRVTAAHDLAVESRPAAQRTSGAETILVVDDTPEVRTLVRRLLESVGYHVLTAASGPEALQLLERHESRIHLVLTDVVMPEMGGRALADRVAASHREVRVLYMSGHTEDTVIQHGVLHATMPFLAKPFSKTALLEKVREVLDTPGALPDD